LDLVPEYFRYTWDVYYPLIRSSVRWPHLPSVGIYNLCCGTRLSFASPHPVVSPNPIGAKTFLNVEVQERDGVACCVDMTGKCVDVLVAEDYGSRRKLIPGGKFELTGGKKKRVMSTVAHSGFFIDEVESVGYHVTVCRPKILYVGTRISGSYTFIAFESGYGHCDGLVEAAGSYGARLDNFVNDVVMLTDVSVYCQRMLVMQFPYLKFNYDGIGRITVAVPRAKTSVDFSECCSSLRNLSFGVEIGRSSLSLHELRAKFAGYGEIVPAVEVFRVRSCEGWVPNVVAVYAKVVGVNKVITVRSDDYFWVEGKEMFLYSEGGNIQCERDSDVPGIPRRSDGLGTILPVVSCSFIGPRSVREAFRSMAGTKMKCYRHAEFEEIGKGMPMIEVADFG